MPGTDLTSSRDRHLLKRFTRSANNRESRERDGWHHPAPLILTLESEGWDPMASLRKKGKVWYVRVRDESGRQPRSRRDWGPSTFLRRLGAIGDSGDWGPSIFLRRLGAIGDGRRLRAIHFSQVSESRQTRPLPRKLAEPVPSRKSVAPIRSPHPLPPAWTSPQSLSGSGARIALAGNLAAAELSRQSRSGTGPRLRPRHSQDGP